MTRRGWALAMPLAAAAVLAAAVGYRVTTTTAVPTAGALAEAAPTRPDSAAETTAHPDDPAAWRALAHARFAVSDYAGAATAGERVVALAPDRAADWSALGEARTLAANAVTAPAHAAFARAVQLDRQDARARYFLGVEKDVAGDHAGAVALWIAVLRDAPAGALYAESIRNLLVQVGAGDRIPRPERPSLPPSGQGSTVASAAIPGPTPDDLAAAAQLPPGQQDAMARDMVDRLATRLRQSPRDLDGWIRLMRARQVLGQPVEAARALADGRQALAGNGAAQAALSAAADRLGIAR